MATSAELEERLAAFIERHIAGDAPAVDTLCADRPDLAPALRALIGRYLALTAALDADPLAGEWPEPTPHDLPRIEGFQVVERIGAGGMGEVYKLRDLTLHRFVAGKVIRRQPSASSGGLQTFLQEARALALFSDRRIVQIFEARLDADPPVIVMELVDGFELGRVAPSLDVQHRARIMIDVCEAVHHAHEVGVQHRDLKPSNIMLDGQLRPRILDFGLSAGDPARGHLVGTPPYMAPEQLDPARPIDRRSDVYALGAILYELLAGAPPLGDDPRLPVEIAPTVPEPLQAIALSAMERDPDRRYQTALDMATDLRRSLDGRAVLARPSVYATTLESRVRPHLDQVGEWLRVRLIHPHEAERLRSAYNALGAREDDWIVESRALSYTQIALYLGAFLLVCGSLFYFIAARWFGAVEGIARPFAVLALPFIGLNLAAHLLYRRDHKAVAVAFFLGAVFLLPIFLLIFFHEAGWLLAPQGSTTQLLGDGTVSNRQLQATTLLACVWCGWLALRTRTSALSSVFTVIALLFAVAVAGDFGLRQAVESERWDHVAFRFLPLVAVYAVLGVLAERTGRRWFSRPLYLAGAAVFVITFELLALDGRELGYLTGTSLAPWQPSAVSNPALLDTVVAMTINGALFYAVASLIRRRGSVDALAVSQLLYVIAPFALLHPLGYLVRTGEYVVRIDWFYAAAAVTVVLLSERRQRRAFYYAGLLNLGLALYFIASHREWFDRPAWAIAVIAAGLATLATGFALDRRRRHPRS